MEQIFPAGGVEVGVLVLGGGFDFVNLGFHQRLPGFAVHGGKLLVRQFEVCLEFLGTDLVHVLDGHGFLGEGAVHPPERDGDGFAPDEDEDQEDHQDGGERHEENKFFRKPFQRLGAMAPLDAHPANAAS